MSEDKDNSGGGSYEQSGASDTGMPKLHQAFLLPGGDKSIIIHEIKPDGTIVILDAKGDLEKIEKDEFSRRRKAGEYLTQQELDEEKSGKVEALETKSVSEAATPTVPETPVAHSVVSSPEPGDPETPLVVAETVPALSDQVHDTSQEPGENSTERKKEFKRLEKKVRVFLNKKSGLVKQGVKTGQYRLTTGGQTEYFSPQKLREHLAEKLRAMRAISEGSEKKLKEEVEMKLGGVPINLDTPSPSVEGEDKPQVAVPEVSPVPRPEKPDPSREELAILEAQKHLEETRNDLLAWIPRALKDLREARNPHELKMAKETVDDQLDERWNEYSQGQTGADKAGKKLFADYRKQLGDAYARVLEEFPEEPSETGSDSKLVLLFEAALKEADAQVNELLKDIQGAVDERSLKVLRGCIEKTTTIGVEGEHELDEEKDQALLAKIESWQSEAQGKLLKAIQERREWIANQDKVVKNGEVYRRALADAREQWTALKNLINDSSLRLENIPGLRADIAEFGMDTSTLDPNDVAAAEKWSADRRAEAGRLLDERERKLNPTKRTIKLVDYLAEHDRQWGNVERTDASGLLA